MNLSDTDRLLDWTLRRGLDGVDESQLLREFCEKCREAGLELSPVSLQQLIVRRTNTSEKDLEHSA